MDIEVFDCDFSLSKKLSEVWESFCGKVNVVTSSFSCSQEISDLSGRFVEVEIPNCECSCGSFSGDSVFFFEMSPWSPRAFLHVLNQVVQECCRIKSPGFTSYLEDCVCPSGNKFLVETCRRLLNPDTKIDLRALYTVYPSESELQAKECHDKFQVDEMDVADVKKGCEVIKPFLCFDLEKVASMCDDPVEATSSSLHLFDMRMMSSFRKLPLDSSVDRYLFQNGLVGKESVLPLSPQDLFKAIQFPAHHSRDADMCLFLRACLNCLKCENLHAREYIGSIVLKNKNQQAVFWQTIKDFAFVLISDKMLKSFVDGKIVPEAVNDFRKRLKDLNLLRYIDGGVSGGDYSERSLDAPSWMHFLNSQSRLVANRSYRSLSGVLDKEWKPISTFETFAYGSCYSTLKKWKQALQSIDKGSVLAIGCGKYNHWKAYLPRGTVYIDKIDFGRSEVLVGDANEYVTTRRFDYIVSDAECVLDYRAISRSAQRQVYVKVLPRFGVVGVDKMCYDFESEGFVLDAVNRCGKLHNGELIVRFTHKSWILKCAEVSKIMDDEEEVDIDGDIYEDDDEEAGGVLQRKQSAILQYEKGCFGEKPCYDEPCLQMSGDVRSRQDFYNGGGKAFFDFRSETSKIILSNMSDCISEGEDARKRNILVLLCKGLRPSLDVKVDREVVWQIPVKHQRGQGSMALWALSKGEGGFVRS